MSLRVLNPNAKVLSKLAAHNMNINATKCLQDVLKSNLVPKGTIKMLVGGAGDIKLTKDGNTLLKEMVLNPNAEVLNKLAALNKNINDAKGLQDVLKSNHSTKSTIKMLVGGDADIKLTKDGNTLLKEMVSIGNKLVSGYYGRL